MRASYLTKLKQDKTLYCCNLYTITYNGNSNTSGTAPVDSYSPYNSGYLVTILDNVGNLQKTNYTFSAWNTAANGSGTPYIAGATYNGGASIILYAQWI